jgi:hypothetical protein
LQQILFQLQVSIFFGFLSPTEPRHRWYSNQIKREKGNSNIGGHMKKLLLLPLIAIGLAFVPAKQADAQVSVGIGGVGVGVGYPGYGYGYGYPGYGYGYYPRSYYNYYGGYPAYRTSYYTGRPYYYSSHSHKHHKHYYYRH